jgi:hypothetical protein
MALLLKQKQVYGIVTGEDERPQYPAEQDATAEETLAHRTAVKDWVKQHGTVRSTILLSMEPRLQTSYMEITDAQTLWEKLATAYKVQMKFNVFQIRVELLGIRLEDCDDVDTYTLWIDQKVKNYNLRSEPSSSNATRTSGKMNNQEHVFYLLRGIPRNDEWQFFLKLMMDKNVTATLTPDEIVIKLVWKEATIKRVNGLGQDALLFTKRNAKGNGKGKGKGKGKKSWKGDESGKNQGDRKSQPTCFYCHKAGHKVWNFPSMKRGDPPVMKESTETAANDDTITACRVSAEMTTIENYWITATGGSPVPSKESWRLDCASTLHISGNRRRFVRYPAFNKYDEREIRDFAGRVAGKAIGQGDVQLRFRPPGGHGRINEVVVRDVTHVAGAHNLLTQSRLMDRGLQIVPVNGFGIKIYDQAPVMGTGHGGLGSLVAMARQVGGLFRFDVDVKISRKGHQARDVSRERKQYTPPNTIPSEYTYTDIMEPEEATNKNDILVPITSTSAIKRPAAGGYSAGNSAGQLKDRVDSSDEHDDEDKSEDEDEDDPPVVIDKSKKTSFTRQLAGLDGNLESAWEAPVGSDRRRRRTDHLRRSSQLEMKHVEAD